MADRTDANGAAFAGSQLQTQLYVNRRQDQLNAAIFDAFPEVADADIEWRSPLVGNGYAEYSDKAFLDRVDLGAHAAGLKAFWPKGGPHWDALAVIRRPGQLHPGVLLAEGKSYPAELYGGGCKAKPGSMSRALIERSLDEAQRRLKVEGQTAADWCGPLYQSANRLAHLAWLRSLGVRAWLVHLLFVDDPHGPTSADDWHTALEIADAELGIAGLDLPGAGHVLLPAGTYQDLTGA